MKVVVEEGGFAPERAHEWDAGLDLRTPIDFSIDPGKRMCIDTLVRVAIPHHCVGFIKSRSGLMVKNGILTDGTIDCHYTGTIGVCIFNHGKYTVHFHRGDKIAQMVVQEVRLVQPFVVESLEATDRGDNGFGSTGR